MTLGEIIKTIKAKQRKHKNELKEKAMQDYKLAIAITSNVAQLVNKENKPIDIYDLNAELFEEEIKEKKKQEEDRLLILQKQRFLDFMEYNNKKFKERAVVDSGTGTT